MNSMAAKPQPVTHTREVQHSLLSELGKIKKNNLKKKLTIPEIFLFAHTFECGGFGNLAFFSKCLFCIFQVNA